MSVLAQLLDALTAADRRGAKRPYRVQTNQATYDALVAACTGLFRGADSDRFAALGAEVAVGPSEIVGFKVQ